jgi:hypothetical protein
MLIFTSSDEVQAFVVLLSAMDPCRNLPPNQQLKPHAIKQHVANYPKQ